MSDNIRQLKINPETVDGFTLTQKLGQGSTGTVFKSKRIADGNMFAIKLIFPALAIKSEFNDKFMRLAQIGAKIDHPNLVKTHSAGVSNGYHYVVMDFVEGKTLENVLARGAMDEQRALQIVQAVARALEHAQGAGVVHRDVKPANILLPRGGEAKLADLGLAVMATNPKMVGGATGTPHYMSPEAARSENKIDIRSDVYSLGATLHHMLTGQTMFAYENIAEIVAAHLSEMPKAAAKVNTTVSASASKLVQRMTEKRPADRPFPAEVVSLVDAILRGEKPFESLSRKGTATVGKAGETEVAIPKDSPTPVMAPPAINIPIPARFTSPREETIQSAPPPPQPAPGRPAAQGTPSPYPPVPPYPPPAPPPAPPGHRQPSTAYPTPPVPGYGQPGYPSPYPPVPPYPAPPGKSGPPPFPPPAPPPYPPPPYPQHGQPPPYPYPPQGYPPPPYPPPQGQPAPPPPPPPPAPPAPPKGGSKKPKPKRHIGRRWGDLI